MNKLPDNLYKELVLDFIGDGDWTKKWAELEESPEELLSDTFAPADVQVAFKELRKLFPPELCKKRAEQRLTPIPGASLFHPGFLHHIRPFVLLGLDLSDAPGWETDNGLVAALRSNDGDYERRFEVGLWASLRRCGLEVERVPEATHKTPDFLVRHGRETIALEVKCLGGSDAAAHGQELVNLLLGPIYWNIDTEAPVFQGKGLHLHFEFSPEIVERMKKKDTSGPTLERLRTAIPSATEFIRAHITTDSVGSRVEVPDFGHMLLTREEAVSFGYSENLEDTPVEDQITRALRSVRDGGEKETMGHPLVVFVHASIFCIPVHAALKKFSQYLEHAGRREADPVHKVDGVILHNYWFREDQLSGKHHFALFLRPSWSRFAEIPMWFANSLHNWQIEVFGKWAPVRKRAQQCL